MVDVDINLEEFGKSERGEMFSALKNYEESKERLLSIEFVTLGEYLHKLKAVAHACSESVAMFVLAAAVSDFYIPEKGMLEHKIQSRSGPLQLELEQVSAVLIKRQCYNLRLLGSEDSWYSTK